MKRIFWGVILSLLLAASFSVMTYAETAVSVDAAAAFINGEAGADGKITLYELLELFAEADSEQEGGQEETLESAGYLSENELAQAYLDCLNGELAFDEFFKSFDKTGYLAYWVSESRGRVTVPEAYAVLEDADQGTAYIAENYPEFCGKWEEYTGEPFSCEALDALTADFDGEDDLLYQDLDAFIQDAANVFGPFDNSVQEDNFWSSDFGYSTYKISVDDPEDYIQSIGVIFMERNGKYYWVMLNQTA